MTDNQYAVRTYFIPFNTTRGRKTRFFTEMGQAERQAIEVAGQGQDGFVGSRSLNEEGFGSIVALVLPAAVISLLENLARLPGVIASGLQTVYPEAAKETLVRQVDELKQRMTGDTSFMQAVERASLDRDAEELSEEGPPGGMLN